MRRILLLFSLLFVSSLQSADRPNIVIFLTDDQGWGDLSVNGNTNLSTPNIDSLAHDGATLENFYVCAVCAPTRAEFLTGRYHLRTGVTGVSEGEGRLNRDETTIADLFKSNGYKTGAFGKWHNGTQSPYHPNDRGFDEFYGFTSGHWGHYFSPPLDHNGAKVRGEGYVVDDFTNKAISFIEENRDNPFFCYIPYNTPHSPMMVDDNFYAKFKDVDPELKYRDPEKEDIMMTRAALAMCENIDWNVGRILEKLEALNLAENTIVVYFSDNGPNSFRWNGGMKGKKGSVDEGGLRSPFFLRWPGKVISGQTVDRVSGAIDLFPTLAELAGIEPKSKFPINGYSFAPHLLGKFQSHEPTRVLFSSWGKRHTAREGDFRLDHGGQLFNINEDRGQNHECSDQYPKVKERLTTALSLYREKMKSEVSRSKDRPFTVGYSESTTLPARDGRALEGSPETRAGIRRSSKAPNNSFFENWTGESDAITWTIETAETGIFEAFVYYTCRPEDVGVSVELAFAEGGAPATVSTRTTVTEAFDPPLYDKSKERVAESHYFVKDFKPLSLGTIKLQAGKGTLTLGNAQIVGTEAIDVHSIELIRK
ncbi:arylsulfatase [Verrucomicrobiales bacterium BCK34]|nr:arylsulfatase [Verrucomicrobiales bacterium BCK34]